jgi:hypothetical protein
LEGHTSQTGSRAAVGTAIHKAAEVIWTNAIQTGKKDLNITKAQDAAVAEFDENCKKEPPKYLNSDTENSSRKLVSDGAGVFVDQIAEFTDIPRFVEKRYAVPISDHPIVKEIGGTLDYISDNTIADLKTSKRAIQTQNHVLQQSIYKFLAEANGHKIDYTLIQGIIFTKVPRGDISALDHNVPQAKYGVNVILDTLRAFYEGTNPDVLFPGNTGYFLCSPQYCDFHPTCKFVQGDIVIPVQDKPVL